MGRRKDRRVDRVPKAVTGYTMGEAITMIAPLVGMDPAELRACLIIGITATGRAGIGGSPNLSDQNTLRVLESLAKSMRARGVRP